MGGAGLIEVLLIFLLQLCNIQLQLFHFRCQSFNNLLFLNQRKLQFGILLLKVDPRLLGVLKISRIVQEELIKAIPFFLG
jgi:hypothetical protein